MKTAVRFPIVLASLLAAGCGEAFGPAPDAVTLTVVSTRYTAGDAATFILHNESEQTVEYNGCFTILERRTDDGWLDARWSPADVVCPAIAYVLESGAQTPIGIPLRVELPSGTYRARLDVRLGGERIELTSMIFEIEGVPHRHD